jgi:hypothetical protein
LRPGPFRMRSFLLLTCLAGGLALGVSVGACAQILGVTDGQPFPDGGDGAGEAHVIDGRASKDVNARDAADEKIRDAGTPECSPLDNFCENRCGPLSNNCGTLVKCPDCEGGLSCTQGACGCIPDTVSVTCQGRNCGAVENNCGQLVACGSDGMRECEHSTDICETEAGTCCTPDPPSVTCANQCGTAPLTNNCGQSVDCSCGDSGVCLSTGVCCNPVSNAEWCANRCGTLSNNCNQPVNCGGCSDGSVCNSNSCDCNPDPPATTCAGIACGFAENNCHQQVPCGISGTNECTKGQVCEMDSGTCCTPNPAPCNGLCDASVQNCGQSVSCGTCPGAGICNGGSCCNPELVSAACEEAGASCGDAQNNCGASVACNDMCAADGGVCAAGDAGPNACCFDDGTACSGLCAGTATNNCGQPVTCMNGCPPGQSCDGMGTCCDDNGMGCVHNRDCCNGNCNAVDGGTNLCCNPSGRACSVDNDCCSATCDVDDSGAGTCN